MYSVHLVLRPHLDDKRPLRDALLARALLNIVPAVTPAQAQHGHGAGAGGVADTLRCVQAACAQLCRWLAQGTEPHMQAGEKLTGHRWGKGA